MKNFGSLLVIVIFIGLCFASHAAAGSIGINLTVAAEVTAESVHVTVRVESGGDEAARKVFPELTLAGESVRLPEILELPPNSGRSWEYDFRLTADGLRLPGIYPILVRLHYSDLNDYPFSRTEVYMARIGEVREPPALEATLDHQGSQEITVRLRNNDEIPLRISFSPFFPEEIEGRLDTDTIDLKPGEKRELHLKVKNRAALAGNRYTLFLKADMEFRGIHYSIAPFLFHQVAKEEHEEQKVKLATICLMIIVVLFTLTAWLELRRGEGHYADR